MKLDRNITLDGTGKYALLNLRTNALEWGNANTEGEFFVIKLKDVFARDALEAYAHSVGRYAERVAHTDPDLCGSLNEWADEVMQMAQRSGPAHPQCKLPD